MRFWVNNVINDFAKLNWGKLNDGFSKFKKFFLIKDNNILFIVNKKESKMIVILINSNSTYNFGGQEYAVVDYFEILNEFLKELKDYTLYKELGGAYEENRIYNDNDN